MKKSLALLLSAVMLLGLLAGCAPKEGGGSDAKPIKDFLSYQTTANEMETFNFQYTQSNKEIRVLANCIDGLLTNDNKGALIPAIATEWTTPDGGENWTFKLRDGAVWVDYQGNEKGKVVANDWLVGMEWTLNFWKNEAANTSMPIEMIVGAGDYYTYTKGYASDATDKEKAAYEEVCTKYGLDPNVVTTKEDAMAFGLEAFSKMVGMTAPDDKTLNIQCLGALPYFPTVGTYNCLYPVPQGMIDEIGVEGYRAVTYDKLWYNGCYTITTYVQNNEKVLTKNPKYWDTESSRFDTVTVKMVESSDVAFQLFQNGELHHVDLTESNLKTIYDTKDHKYNEYLTEARPTKYSYQIHFVYDKKLENGDPDVNWNTAVANKAFRLAWYYGIDRTDYLRRTNAINPIKCANYTYTAQSLSVNSQGVDYTQLVRDNLGIKVDADKIATYDKSKFETYKKQAMEELAAKGVSFPIVADYYIIGNSQTALDTATVLKETISRDLGDDFVTLNIKTYVTSLAQEVRTPRLAAFFINGWGADYGDPKNFVGQETYGDDNAYYSITYSKINDATDPDLIATYKEFTKMVQEADAILDNMDNRFAAFAKAETYMIENALVIPFYVNIVWHLTHVNDYSKIYCPYGTQSEVYKNWETSETLYSTADYAKFEAAYNGR